MSKGPPPPDHDDNPEWTEEDFAEARPARKIHGAKTIEALTRSVGRPAGSDKERITIRIDKDILARFRATGPGWQTRMNDALRTVQP